MALDDNEDRTIYKVVINHEEQYSIWPVDRENPLGWRDAGKDHVSRGAERGMDACHRQRSQERAVVLP